MAPEQRGIHVPGGDDYHAYTAPSRAGKGLVSKEAKAYTDISTWCPTRLDARTDTYTPPARPARAYNDRSPSSTSGTLARHTQARSGPEHRLKDIHERKNTQKYEREDPIVSSACVVFLTLHLGDVHTHQCGSTDSVRREGNHSAKSARTASAD